MRPTMDLEETERLALTPSLLTTIGPRSSSLIDDPSTSKCVVGTAASLAWISGGGSVKRPAEWFSVITIKYLRTGKRWQAKYRYRKSSKIFVLSTDDYIDLLLRAALINLSIIIIASYS
jgi:hypothetical protein